MWSKHYQNKRVEGLKSINQNYLPIYVRGGITSLYLNLGRELMKRVNINSCGFGNDYKNKTAIIIHWMGSSLSFFVFVCIWSSVLVKKWSRRKQTKMKNNKCCCLWGCIEMPLHPPGWDGGVAVGYSHLQSAATNRTATKSIISELLLFAYHQLIQATTFITMMMYYIV